MLETTCSVNIQQQLEGSSVHEQQLEQQLEGSSIAGNSSSTSKTRSVVDRPMQDICGSLTDKCKGKTSCLSAITKYNFNDYQTISARNYKDKIIKPCDYIANNSSISTQTSISFLKKSNISNQGQPESGNMRLKVGTMESNKEAKEISAGKRFSSDEDWVVLEHNNGDDDKNKSASAKNYAEIEDYKCCDYAVTHDEQNKLKKKLKEVELHNSILREELRRLQSIDSIARVTELEKELSIKINSEQELQSEVAFLRMQVKQFREDFDAERRAFREAVKLKKKFEKSCRVYEVERDNAMQRARDSENEVAKLTVENIRLNELLYARTTTNNDNSFYGQPSCAVYEKASFYSDPLEQMELNSEHALSDLEEDNHS